MHKLLRSKSAIVGLLVLLLEVAVGLLAPWLAPHDPLAVGAGRPFLPVGSPGFLLGTDDIGRDILSRILFGTRITLQIGGSVLAVAALLGVPLGLLAAYYRRYDGLIMRPVEMLMALPALLLALVIAMALGTGLTSIIIAVSIFSIPSLARVTRGAALTTMNLEYVEAARAQGATDARILLRHVLPACVGPLVVQASFTLATGILTAAALSFLGVGVKPPAPEWGAMLGSGRAFLFRAPHISLYPGLAIFLTVMALNLLGDGIQDLLDPRIRRQ